VLTKLDAVTRDIVVAYREFRLHDAYLALQKFDSDDLSAFYVDALKDRLYTSAPGSARRRSAQSAVLEIFRTIAVLTAPILSFTAEEAWQALPAGLRGDDESIFDLAFRRSARSTSPDWNSGIRSRRYVRKLRPPKANAISARCRRYRIGRPNSMRSAHSRRPA